MLEYSESPSVGQRNAGQKAGGSERGLRLQVPIDRTSCLKNELILTETQTLH